MDLKKGFDRLLIWFSMTNNEIDYVERYRKKQQVLTLYADLDEGNKREVRLVIGEIPKIQI